MLFSWQREAAELLGVASSGSPRLRTGEEHAGRGLEAQATQKKRSEMLRSLSYSPRDLPWQAPVVGLLGLLRCYI